MLRAVWSLEIAGYTSWFSAGDLNEDGSNAGTLSPVDLQLGLADGTEHVPVALGRQCPTHRRQVRAAGQRRGDWVTVDVHRNQADHV